MTPREFSLEAEAYFEREERSRERDAWKLHWQLAGMVKDPPSIDRILGRDDGDSEMSVEEFQMALRDINRGGGSWVTKSPKRES